MASWTTGCSEQIVHTAARSCVYAPGVMCGKMLQHIQKRRQDRYECTILTLNTDSSTIALHHCCYYPPINDVL